VASFGEACLYQSEVYKRVVDEDSPKPNEPRRIRVMFVGFEVFWMRVLVEGLSSGASDVLECAWILWPSTWLERFRFVVAMMHSDVVVRIGMPFEFESETNRVWLHWIARSRRVRGVNYWIGYDVRLIQVQLASRLPSDDEQLALRVLSHWAGAPNMTEALDALGIAARTVVFPSPSRPIPERVPPLPKQFRALLYWRDDTWEYSSGPELVAAARRLPDIEFDVLGATGSNVLDPPSNLTFHGRVSDMDRMYERAAVVVKVVEWDSVPGGMVEEALLFGRQVIYSFEFPYTVFVKHRDEEGLVAALSDMRDAHMRGDLDLNLEGRDMIIRDWVPDTRWAALREQLLLLGTEPAARSMR
jgi:hypothetical protein